MCVNSALAYFFGFSKEIMSSAIWLKMCVITPGIKKHKSIIKKKGSIIKYYC